MVAVQQTFIKWLIEWRSNHLTETEKMIWQTFSDTLFRKRFRMKMEGGSYFYLVPKSGSVNADVRGKRNLRFDHLWVSHHSSEYSSCEHNGLFGPSSLRTPLACVLGPAKVAIYWVLSSQHKVNIFSSWMLARAEERSSDSAWESTQSLAPAAGIYECWEPAIKNTWPGGFPPAALWHAGVYAALRKKSTTITNQVSGAVRPMHSPRFVNTSKQRCSSSQKHRTRGWVGKDAQKVRKRGKNSPTKIATQSLSSSELICLNITLIANKNLQNLCLLFVFSPWGEQASGIR